jgi:WD40 repeat protein
MHRLAGLAAGLLLALAVAGTTGARQPAKPPAATAEAPLPAGAIARLSTPFPRHAAPLHFLAFTPDGRSLVTQGGDGPRVWDAATGKEVRRFAAAAGTVFWAAALSPDGTRLATLELEQPDKAVARLWDVATGKAVRELAAPPWGTGWPKMLFSPDGKKIAGVCYESPRVVVWDVATGKQVLAWDGAPRRVWDVAFTPDGKELMTGGDDGVVQARDAATGKPLRKIGSDLGEVGRLALSPDGAVLATVGQRRDDGKGADYWQGDDCVRLWDVATGKLLRRLSVPAGGTYAGFPVGLNSLAFTPDGKRLAAGGADRALRVWEVATGAGPRQTRDEAGAPGLLAFAPDGKRLAVVTLTPEVMQLNAATTAAGIPLPEGVGTSGRRLFSLATTRPVFSAAFHVRDFETGKEQLRLSGHGGGVALTALSPDGRTAATASVGPDVLLWDAATGRELRRLTVAGGEVTALAFTEDGRGLLAAAADQTLRTLDVATGKETAKVPARGNPRWAWPAGPHGKVVLSPDRKLLAVVDRDGGVVLTDVATGKEVSSLAVSPGEADYLFFGADGRTLFIGTTESRVHAWGLKGGKDLGSYEVRDGRLAPFQLFFAASDGALTPDEKVLAVCRQDGTLVMIDAATERVLRTVPRREWGDFRIAVSPDGRTLAWGGMKRDPSIFLLDVATGRQRRLVGHDDRVLSLTFSPDGRALLSGSDDGTAILWDLTASP